MSSEFSTKCNITFEAPAAIYWYRDALPGLSIYSKFDMDMQEETPAGCNDGNYQHVIRRGFNTVW